jgi:membrane-bound lytic murein transglycosylase D
VVRPDQLLGSVRAWLAEELDGEALARIGLEVQAVDEVLAGLEDAARRLPRAGEVSQREDAEALAAGLDRFEWTRPGAVWLRSWLNQGDGTPAAPEVRVEELPSVAAPRDPLRVVWEERLASRPWPARASEFVPLLKEIFAEEGVPPELVWIAEVESGFNPVARSRVGALGLFQLMPDTAEELGLSVDARDDRRDARMSARAAARYLRALRRQFQDWQLALAAYNAGPGRVTYWLASMEATTFAEIAVRLPEETQQYVPKVEATLWLREGVELRELSLPAGGRRASATLEPVTTPPASGNRGPG